MPQHIPHIMTNLPSLIAQGGYWLLFVIVVLEAIPIIGSFVPGHVTIIVAGFLAKIGLLNLPAVMIITVVAALLGDLLGFYLGRHYGYSFLTRYGRYLFIKEEHIERAKKLIDEHRGKTLILGKFNPITRSLPPFLVGASDVSLKSFLSLNTIGIFAWAIGSILLGYVFGASYYLVAPLLGKFTVIAILAMILIIWGYRFVNIRFHVFKKYELFVLILNLISLYGLAKTIQDAIATNSFMKNFDIWVNLFMAQHVTSFMADIAFWISNIGSTLVTFSLGIIIAIVFLYHKKWRRASIMLFSMIGTSAVLIIMKYMFMRVRPDNALQHLTDPSFPSGHAGLAAAFFLAIAYLLAPHIYSWVKRETFIVFCTLAIILIGLSRVMLNVHWASDVIAGWCLGIFITTSSILLVRYVGAFFLKMEMNNKEGTGQ